MWFIIGTCGLLPDSLFILFSQELSSSEGVDVPRLGRWGGVESGMFPGVLGKVYVSRRVAHFSVTKKDGKRGRGHKVTNIQRVDG